ncbi:MAG: hypothetical protein HGA54_09160, partial [Actinobacteria bacterium]|nr:hypothetical protein [Actinomycetota bacterium]
VSFAPGFLLTASIPFRPGTADLTASSLDDDDYRKQFERELALLRGEMHQVLERFQAIDLEGTTCLAELVVTATAAISTGEYLYLPEIENAFDRLKEDHKGIDSNRALIELSQATIAVNIHATEQYPRWLTAGDFSCIPKSAKPFALYVYCRYLHNVGDITRTIAVAETTLALHESELVTLTDIYLHIVSAVALLKMQRFESAEKHVCNALSLALPDGLLAPFAEYFTDLNGVLGHLLSNENPEAYNRILDICKMAWKNWIHVHNHASNEEITTILTLRQYQVASLAKNGYTNAQISEQLGLSAGSVKSYLQSVYEKLFITTRKELDKFII